VKSRIRDPHQSEKPGAVNYKYSLGTIEAHPGAQKLSNGFAEAHNGAMEAHNRGVEDVKASYAVRHQDDDDPNPHKKAGSGYASK
jgi:hypothetical protein